MAQPNWTTSRRFRVSKLRYLPLVKVRLFLNRDYQGFVAQAWKGANFVFHALLANLWTKAF
ncbi:hypothetical protein D2H32_02855 [Vibrio parahaemolyticus]|nr:hypothetical protein [Vibrio parahaemolyticus]EGR1958346.1 hypothetical protein [Vibrio parahaemolyticus]EGR1967119.1 hypothetical protein [Vibrio parahaemolyticus]